MDIQKIIETKSIEILMQPVLAPVRELAIGIEALARGIEIGTNKVIGAGALIQAAEKAGFLFELEKMLIQSAIIKYTEFYKQKSDTLLFINIDAKILSFCLEDLFILELLDEYSLPYGNVVFDINGLDFSNYNGIKEAIKFYRDKGFAISIDDLGRDYNNLDKIIMINPDIIKINTSRLNQLDDEMYKENIFSLLGHISQKLGIVIVAKGIENKEELIIAVKNGAQFIQGYYISKPIKLNTESLDQIIDSLYDRINIEDYIEDNHYEQNRIITGKLARLTERLGNNLSLDMLSDIEKVKLEFFDEYPFIENIWYLDENGIQISESFNNSDKYKVRHASIFQTYKKGSDFSKKELYRQLTDTILNVWLTKPFVSMLTNNVCVGASTYISDTKMVFCMNINYEEFLKRKGKIQ